MTTQRVFTVEVKNCKNCPFKHHDRCYHGDMNLKPNSKCEAVFSENQNAITPSCPMHPKTFLKDETK